MIECGERNIAKRILVFMLHATNEPYLIVGSPEVYGVRICELSELSYEIALSDAV